LSAFSKILKLSKSGDSEDDALERLRKILRQDPRSLQFVALADLCRKRLLFDEAISVCLQGLSHHPGYVSGFVALARAYQEAGDISRAIDAYHRVVDLSPQNLVGHLGLGDLCEQAGRQEEARDHLVSALHLGASVPDLVARIQRLERSLMNPDGPPALERSFAAVVPAAPPDRTTRLLRDKISALEAYRARFKLLPD
jgi:tetratricopeptide (TPR) repeat protein